jgi:hypothetical protein
MVLLGRIELPTSSLPKQRKHGIISAFPMALDDRGCALAVDPRQTQTVRGSGFSVFLLKVFWSNRIGKSDLRQTYGTAG